MRRDLRLPVKGLGKYCLFSHNCLSFDAVPPYVRPLFGCVIRHFPSCIRRPGFLVSCFTALT